MNVLVPNLGSTSLKYQLIDLSGERVLARGKVERIGGQGGPATHREAIQQAVDHIAAASGGAAIDAVGFKAVHAGPRYRGSFQVTDDLLEAMREFLPVAPVHNAVYIAAMENFRELLPDVPMVAVFEPGFHATMPDHASIYGVPHEWTEKYGVRRYGFHGSST